MLDGFAKSMRDFEISDIKNEEREIHTRFSGFLDPILAKLSSFTTPSSLNEQIEALFLYFDTNYSGTVSFEEWRDGLLKLKDTLGRVSTSRSDWEAFTNNGHFLDASSSNNKFVENKNDALSPEGFNKAIRLQLILFSYRLVAAKTSQAVAENSEHSAVYLAFKLVMLGIFREVRAGCAQHACLCRCCVGWLLFVGVSLSQSIEWGLSPRISAPRTKHIEALTTPLH